MNSLLMRYQDAVDGLLRECTTEDALSLVIHGVCMRPVIEDGQTVRLETARRLWPGDVVVFHGPGGRLLAHRYLLAYRRHNVWKVLTKADRASCIDSPVPTDRVLGRAVTNAGPSMTARIRCASIGAFWLLGRALRRFGLPGLHAH